MLALVHQVIDIVTSHLTYLISKSKPLMMLISDALFSFTVRTDRNILERVRATLMQIS